MGFRLELPPSLGRDSVHAAAREFASVLYAAGFETVAPAPSYTVLIERLLSGEADAAWGPPLVCARLEQAGGRVVLRSIRYGASGYRAALVCRKGDAMDLPRLASGRRRPRAVWVDPFSMAGHVLPRSFLRASGLDVPGCFVGEEHVGSYDACLNQVLDGEADLTASFASSSTATKAVDGYVQLTGPRASELRAFAYTRDCPNDGVVLSPRLSAEQAQELRVALMRLVADRNGAAQLAAAFGVDGFDPPPDGTYAPLLGLL